MTVVMTAPRGDLIQVMMGQMMGDGICNSYIIPGRTVYIVGSSYDSEGNYTACYWKDGVRYELPGGSWATDIFVENGTVYTSGTGRVLMLVTGLIRHGMTFLRGKAEAITVHNGDIYVAGHLLPEDST